MAEIQVVITVNDTGQLNVQVPPGVNRVLVYGILELAKEALSNAQREADNRVQPAPPGLVIPRA